MQRWKLPARIENRCYKNSYAYSAVYAATMLYVRSSGAMQKVDAFVCSYSEFARQKLLSANVAPEQLFVRPNCIDASQVRPAIGTGNYVAYIGRLSNEKGLWTLIHAMENLPGTMLKIAGTGPEEAAIRAYIEKKAILNIQMLGFISGDARAELSGRTACLRSCLLNGTRCFRWCSSRRGPMANP